MLTKEITYNKHNQKKNNTRGTKKIDGGEGQKNI